jgi:signal transduction histidine kinase
MYMAIERRSQPQQGASRRPAPIQGTLKVSEAAHLQRRAADARQDGRPEGGYPLTRAETQALLAKLELLTQANGELEAFNATVAHDLCTPLTAINGYCQVLKEICGEQLDANSQEYLQGIYQGTLRMKEIISSMLELSQVTQEAPHREKVDLSGLANLVTQELKIAAPQRSVTVRIAQGITGDGDPGLWRSVLDNLIGNAWKFSAGRKKTVIEFGTTLQAGKPACFVRDNGPGFDMSLSERLFLPFQRAPGTGVEGHGIGLATVARIVRRLGGQVWAESAPGAGATFFFTTE